MLKGQSAIVTGSTRGIGLAIASTLARAGVNTVINGSGDAAEIERVRTALASEAGVEVLYSTADMSKQQVDAHGRSGQRKTAKLILLGRYRTSMDVWDAMRPSNGAGSLQHRPQSGMNPSCAAAPA